MFAVLSGVVASNNNRDATKWSIIGFLFGLFGFIAAIAVGEAEETQPSSRQTSQSSSTSTQEFDPDDHEKKCPDCAEYIKLEARVCKHCGHEFSEEEVEQQVEERRESVKESESANGGKRDEENYKSDEYDTEEILSTHDFNGVGICEDCDYTKGYVKANNYVCPGS